MCWSGYPPRPGRRLASSKVCGICDCMGGLTDAAFTDLDPVVLSEPVDALFPVSQQIPRPYAGATQHRLARQLAGHGLDQLAFGPVEAFHGPYIARAQAIAVRVSMDRSIRGVADGK